MRGRRGWVLVLLAAVFSMHGFQCAAEDGIAASGAHETVHAVAASGPGQVPHAVGSAAATADDPRGTDDPGPHGSEHLWAACLAILAAGLTALLLGRVRRLPAVRLLPLRRTTRGTRPWLLVPRPPDLRALCLMRI